MSKKVNLHDFMRDLADGIRAKEGTTDLINPQDFRNHIDNLKVPTGDSAETTLNALIDGTLTEIESDVESVGSYAFYSRAALTSASFPNARVLSNGTMAGSGNYATYLGAFSYCTALTSVSFPNLTSIGTYAFSYCTALTSVSFPNVTSIGNYAFSSCTALTSASFPNATSVANNAFNKCYQLTSVIIGTNLTTVATLNNTNAFNYCFHILGTVNTTYNPNGLKDGYIYVPLALVESYRTATNWSTYATQIMPYVNTVSELLTIDSTTYDKACVGTDYVEYSYNGTTWEIYTRE